MLRELRINNFAIIDRLEIRFHERLNVLTGETGSGKSIMVEAVDLLLGGRPAAEQIRTGCDEAVLEAAFELPPKSPVLDPLQVMDLRDDAGGDLILRRVLTRAGKSRAYINGNLVTVGQLQQVGNLLVDLHGQHEHQSLLQSDQQLYMLDAYGRLLELRAEFRGRRARYLRIAGELSELEGSERDRMQREDLLNYQAEEIGAAQLTAGEDLRLEKEREVLSNSARLSSLAEEAYQSLYGEDGAILSRLAGVESALLDLARIDDRMRDPAEGCARASVELQELSRRLRDYREEIEFDPERLEAIEERLHRIAALKKKYAPTIEGILELHRKLEDERDGLAGRDERLRSLKAEGEQARAECADLASRLTRERTRTARQLEKKVEQELGHLKMGRTRFAIRIESTPGTGEFGPSGSDTAEFLVAANPGEEPKPLARVASGGELSRIMLALKSILASVDSVPTLVFDEVDAGIGGAVAEVVGHRLKALARHRQVICVTHLPQIASQAAEHFTVQKNIAEGRTVTRVRRLEKEDRVEEIARMLGGREMTPTAFKHAREMLDLGAG